MSLLRNETSIETIKSACPICHSDVKGNDEYLYYCVPCNILFRKEDLLLDKEVIHDILKQKVVERFDKDKDKIKIQEEPIKEKPLTQTKKIIIEDLRKAKKYYISKKSNIIHMANCPYGKNIKKDLFGFQ